MPKAAATQPGLVDRIAHDIQSGVYGAGAWLKQIDLQERYDCTRLEVRRALDQLTAKRLIAHIPNRGYHVYAMDPDVHGQIRDIRILLETGAAADLMPNVTSAKVRAARAGRALRQVAAGRHAAGTVRGQPGLPRGAVRPVQQPRTGRADPGNPRARRRRRPRNG